MIKKKILLVDDNRDLVDALVELLADEDISADFAYSAKSAKDLCEKHLYEMIFVDLSLKDYSGLQLRNDLRATQVDAHFFILSGYQMPSILRTLTDGKVSIYEKSDDIDTISAVLLQAKENDLTIWFCDCEDGLDRLSNILAQHKITFSRIGPGNILDTQVGRSDNTIFALEYFGTVLDAVCAYVDLRNHGCKHPTIIFVRVSTLDDTTPLSHDSLKAGFLSKPVDIDLLLNLARNEKGKTNA